MLVGAVIGLGIGLLVARWRSRSLVEGTNARDEAEEVQQAEIERILSALPGASIMVDGSGAPIRVSNQALALTLVQNGRIAIPEIVSMVADVRRDSVNTI